MASLAVGPPAQSEDVVMKEPEQSRELEGDEEEEEEEVNPQNNNNDNEDDEEGDEDEEEEEEEEEEDGNSNKQTDQDKNENPFEYLAEPPNSMKGLVACRACALVKTFDQFYEHDCDNCDIMGREDRSSRIRVTTTPHFDGLCGIFQPEHSWAARWQGFNSLKPGLYALKVLEELPADIKAELDQTKTPYLKMDTASRREDDLLGGDWLWCWYETVLLSGVTGVPGLVRST